MRRVVALVLLLGTPAMLAAQRMGFAPHFHGRSSAFHGEHFRHFGNARGYYPLGWLDPYADNLDAGYPVASQPPVIVVQQPQAAATPEPPAAPTQPLVIELQGDRYVQVSGDPSSQAQMIDSASERRSSQTISQSHGATAAGSVVLVFRDGRSQEISAYTIADGVVYVVSDYATTGEWTQAIELASLNVPETVATNSSRGFHFQLPRASNEVIVGP